PRLRQFTASSLTLLHTSASILASIVVYQIASQNAVYAKGSEPMPLPIAPFAASQPTRDQLTQGPAVDQRPPSFNAQTPFPPALSTKAPQRRQ
ncbi:MAG: hypothetical protein HC805_06010, partial [Alkalinema sp. RL_2_19]|nr:hypothetical protein [Alkalinema sp. RL_2_19]